jgi:hypothetical protein
MERIYLSSGTPKPSDRDLARFRVLIEPADRVPLSSWWPRTVGEALDTQPGLCRTRYLMYKAALERVTFLVKACGKASCPACVVGWVSARAGAAWAFWNGRATLVKVAGGHHSERTYDRLGIRMRGPNATPGVLSVPVPGGRGLFVPAGIVDGYNERGSSLDATLIRTLRAIPFDSGSAGKPVDHLATIPDRLSAERFAELTKAAGVPLDIRGVRHRVFWGVDQASWDLVRPLARRGS